MSDSNTTTYVPADSGAARAQPSLLRTFIRVLIVVALAALYWLFWQQQQTIKQLEDQLTPLAATSAGLSSLQVQQQQADSSRLALEQQLQQSQLNQQQAQSSLLQQLQLAMTNASEQTLRLSQLSSEFAALESRVALNGGDLLRDQVLAEVGGMLRLAELQLQVAQDVDIAATLLRNADALLARFADSAVADLRLQIANDLAAVVAVQKIDVMALYNQLGTLIKTLDTLQAVSATAVADLQFESPQAAGLPLEPSWFDQAAAFLGQYFVVTERDTAITPLLSPQQDWLIRHGIELQLQQARLAVLSGNVGLYQAALSDAHAALQAKVEGNEKAEALAQLEALMNAKLRSEVPSLAATITKVAQVQQRPAGAAL